MIRLGTSADLAAQGVDVWEIWNGTELGTILGAETDPAAYVRLLTATSAAIHAVNPRAVVLSGGLSPTATGPSDIAPLSFMQSLYQDGGGPFIDGVAVHPYSYPYLPTSTSRSNAFAQVPAIRALMVSHGDAKKAVWLTEYGAPTGASAHAVSDAVQAHMVQQAFNQIRQWPWVPCSSGTHRGEQSRRSRRTAGADTSPSGYRLQPQTFLRRLSVRRPRAMITSWDIAA